MVVVRSNCIPVRYNELMRRLFNKTFAHFLLAFVAILSLGFAVMTIAAVASGR